MFLESVYLVYLSLISKHHSAVSSFSPPDLLRAAEVRGALFEPSGFAEPAALPCLARSTVPGVVWIYDVCFYILCMIFESCRYTCIYRVFGYMYMIAHAYIQHRFIYLRNKGVEGTE